MREMPDAIILCGGFGTRLRQVTGDAPKSMARIGDRPFLDVLLHQLARGGFRRVILAVGYKAGAIEEYYGSERFGLSVVYSREESPLGTGGALVQAATLAETDVCIAMNGDSYTDLELGEFAQFQAADSDGVSVAVTPVDGRTDTGSVRVNEQGLIDSFAEKAGAQSAGFNNAGMYGLPKQLLLALPLGVPLSLEREILPRWIAEGQKVRAFVHPGKCVDIGTPERYEAAQEIMRSFELETEGRI